MAIENLDFRINAAIDAGNSAKTLGDLKTSLKELRELAAQTGPENTDQFNKLATAAGQVNDKIKDVRESVSALSGTPMERLGNSFSRLRQSIFEMDLEKFRLSLVGIKDAFIAIGAQALSPFKNLAIALAGLVTGTTSLTVAMRALGGAIAATGIGALVVGVGLLVAYWKDLEGAGGLVGNVFKAVTSTIDSATNALKSFAQTLGLIGSKTQQAINVPPGQSASGERQFNATDKDLYEREKRLFEDRVDRIQAQRKLAKELIDDELRLAKASITNKQDLAKKEDELIKKRLNQETTYLDRLEQEQMNYLRKAVDFNLKQQKVFPLTTQLEELQDKISDTQDKLLGFTRSDAQFQKANAKLIEETKKNLILYQDQYTEVFSKNEEVTQRAAEELQKFFAGESTGGNVRVSGVLINVNDLANQIDNITKDAAKKAAETRNEMKSLTRAQQIEESERLQSQTQAAKEEAKLAAVRKPKPEVKKETIKSDLQILEEMAATEDNFLKKRLKVQEDWNRSAEEIDAMYREISLEGEYTKSEDIFTEIDRRLQYQSDANEKARLQEEAANLQMSQNKATQFDLENLMISRNHDVFSDEMNYRIEIDNMYADIQAQNATWTSEMIYEEIRKRLQYQIDAYDAEKQAAIDKTNKIIDTARYGAQALDGINQFIYTLDENRRIAGEMTEKEVALRAFKRQQAFGMVNAAINTAAGITAVLASPTNKIDPTGTLMNLQIAFISLAGAAQIAAIASQKFDPNSFGSTPDTPSVGATLPTSVAPGQFVPFTEFKPGDLEERRVYVVESDITGIQRKVQVIENRSKF